MATLAGSQEEHHTDFTHGDQLTCHCENYLTHKNSCIFFFSLAEQDDVIGFIETGTVRKLGV